MQFSSFSAASESFGLIADWTYALNKDGELSEVLDRLMRLVKADAALIIRSSKADNRAQYIARCDLHKGKIWPTQPQSYAKAIIGEFFSSAKAGSIWKLSDTVSSDLSAMPNGSDVVPNHFFEGIVSPLETTPGHVDHIEFHFKQRPAEHDLNLLIIVIGTFAVGWRRRAPALISKKLNQRQKLFYAPANEGRQYSVLDSENPAHLSRSEYRVCSLLSEGMTVSVIAKALSISPATVRSHLSSVFSKTGASSQVELLHQLNRKSEPSSTEIPSEKLRLGRI